MVARRLHWKEEGMEGKPKCSFRTRRRVTKKRAHHRLLQSESLSMEILLDTVALLALLLLSPFLT